MIADTLDLNNWPSDGSLEGLQLRIQPFLVSLRSLGKAEKSCLT